MLLWITLTRDSLNIILNMKKVLSIVALGLIIAFKAMAYEEANYQVVKMNEFYEKAKSDFEIQRMQTAAQIEEQQMAQQFEYNMKLKQAELKNQKAKEKEIEDRKDERTRIQATQQSQMINQRKNDLLPTDFEQQNLGIDEIS